MTGSQMWLVKNFQDFIFSINYNSAKYDIMYSINWQINNAFINSI